MYRSKRADKIYFLSRLKFWLICSACLIAIGIGVFFYFWVTAEATNEAQTDGVFISVENFDTYVTTSEALIVDNTYLSEGAQDMIDDRFAETIPTRIPGVYRTKIVSLTFDDGPSWLTEELLDILDKYDVRVTFCVVGNRVEDHKDTVIRAFEAGHEIIGHSWNHAALARHSVQNIQNQITNTSDIIAQVTGEQPPRLFRVPYGQFNTRIKNAAIELGYSLLNWSVDPEDWRYRCEETIHQHIMENVCDGAIILLHDIHQTSVTAMETVIPELLDQGYTFVLATELIYHIHGDLEPGVEYTGLRLNRQEEEISDE